MFDYIVVGGGSAGCVVASRLSEESRLRVLLLEAGGADRHPFIHVPAAFSRLFKTSVDWHSNLTIVTSAHATRVLMEGNRAVGVEYVRRGRLEQARTGGEVALCGGAIHSPHLLMLSGIGPQHDLESLNIPVAVELPGVGKNLQDHVLHGGGHACTQPVALDRAATLLNFLRAWLRGKGPSTSNVAEGGGFVRTDARLERPDLQPYFAPAYFIEHVYRLSSKGFVWLGESFRLPLSIRIAVPNAYPARTSPRKQNWPTICAIDSKPFTIRPEPAKWARILSASSIRACKCMERRGCA